MLARCMIAVAVFVANLLSFAAFAQVSVDERLSGDQPHAVIAHRSAEMGGAPENSLAWIRQAIERGVDMVHVNPQLTADDRYVLMHDSTLNRTTDVADVFPSGPPGGPTREQRGGKDYVRDYTVAEIRRLRLAGGRSGSLEAVPTLEEVLDLAAGRVLVLLGMKSYEVASLASALEGRETANLFLHELVFSGTDQTKLRQAADVTGLGVAASLFRSRDYLADFNRLFDQLGSRLKMVSVKSSRITEAFLARVEETGVRLVISGWNGPEDRALVQSGDPGPWTEALGVAFAALTDQPELVLGLLGR